MRRQALRHHLAEQHSPGEVHVKHLLEPRGIGGQLVQHRILEAERRLDLTAHLLLAKEVGDVVGAECAGGVGFAESSSYCLGSIFANQCEELADLSSQRAVAIGQTPQIGFASWT